MWPATEEIPLKKKSLLENIIYNVVYQLLVTALPIITSPYTARVLGLRTSGFHSYTESIVTYFIIFGFLGTALYGTRKIAYVRDTPEALTQAAWDIIWLRFILMVVTLAVYIPLLCIHNEFAYLYRIQIINIVASGLDISWFFQGVEDFKRVALRNMLVKLAYVICLFTLIKSPSDLSLYVFLIVASAFLGNLVMWFFLPQYLGKRSMRKPTAMKQHLAASFGLFIPQITNYVYALLDRSMLKWMTGNTDYVSIYDYGQRIIRAIAAVLQSVGYVMMARIANLQAANDREQIQDYIQKSMSLTLFFALPIMFGLGGIAKDFAPLFLGKEFASVSLVLQLLCPLAVTLSVNSVLGVQLLISVGKEKQYTVATTTGAVVNTIINLLLLPSYNVVGACISSLCAEIIVMAITYHASREYLSIKDIAKENAVPFFTAAAMFGIVLAIQQLSIQPVVRLLLEIGVGAVFYAAVMYITKNKVMMLICSRWLNRLHKRKL